MASDRRKTCQVCRRHESEVGSISWRGRCNACGTRRMDENALGLHHHTGEPLERWRRGMAASVGAALLEDLDALAGQD